MKQLHFNYRTIKRVIKCTRNKLTFSIRWKENKTFIVPALQLESHWQLLVGRIRPLPSFGKAGCLVGVGRLR